MGAVLADKLTAERVLLAPITTDEEVRFLYWLAQAGENGLRWRYRLQIPPFEVFAQQLHADVLCQFVVVDRAGGDRIGHAVIYSADLRSGTAHAGAVMHPEWLGTGLGRDALDLLVNYGFDVWPLRKIYAEVPDFTFQHFEHNHPFHDREMRPWHYEGTLREHIFADGRYWDCHQVSVWRNRAPDVLTTGVDPARRSDEGTVDRCV